MKIVTYNVNGIRAAIRKGFYDWLDEGDFDVVCLQEVKALDTQVDLEPLRALGYEYAWHAAEKLGYSGVATLWRGDRLTPKQHVVGCGIADYDCEGRIMRTDFEDFTLLNCYFPSGSSAEARQAIKMRFLGDFAGYLADLRAGQPNVIVVGDYNIAHTERDIHNPKANAKSSGFLPEERAWVDDYLATGMVDAFREVHPEGVQYSWWSFRGGARANDKGWRIDYQMVTEPLRGSIRSAEHRREDVHSDHAALVVEYEF